MIRNIFIIALLTSCFSAVSAQDLVNRVAVEICNCVDTIENIDSLDAKLNRCAPLALETILEESSEEVQEAYSTEEAFEETLKKAFEVLLSECPKIRYFIIEERKSTFYKASSNEDANRYYESGNALLEKEDFKGAIKNYSKAIKKDPGFIFPIDNKGLAYRRSGDNKNAVKYYLKSLEIYPEGSFALTNLAVVYTQIKDYNAALDCYGKIVYYYPTDPEGYFGFGQVMVLLEDYEKAIDYVFIAHKIYTIQESDYAKDSQELAMIIFSKLKEKEKLDLFYQKALDYGISVDGNKN